MINFDAAHAAELAKEVLTDFWLLEFRLSATQYFTSLDVPIYHNGHVYQPGRFDFSDLIRSATLAVDKITLNLDNTDLSWSALVLGEDIRNKDVIISTGVKLRKGTEAAPWAEFYSTGENHIFSVAVYEGKLYAGTYPSGKIYVYDGSSWELCYDSPDQYIFSLCVYNGKLYAGSGNDNTGGHVYAYDGVSWTENYAATEWQIWDLVVYDGKLYAGTYPNGKILVYDGSSWALSYDSPDGYIMSLCVYAGRLYSGGNPGGKIYVYDGSSWALSYDSPEDAVYSLCVYNGKLYAGTYGNGKIYAYDGSSWALSYYTGQSGVWGLGVYNGRLYAGTWPNGNVYVYDGSSWSLSGAAVGNIYCFKFAVYNGVLYAGTGDQGRICSKEEPHVVNVIQEWFYGIARGWKIEGDSKVSISVVNEFARWNERTLRPQSSSCAWAFKQTGGECGYAGLGTWCDQSYERCKGLGNELNFGGDRFLPAVVEKELWWGRERGAK
jgi:outer membrane protein assembly factor BamB